MVRTVPWAPKEELEALRARFPGPRNGVNWRAVSAAALDKTGHNPTTEDRKR